MWRKIEDFFRIESLTTRVRLAFLSIVLLLIFSGAMSLVELQRVSNDTEEILMASKSNSELAVEMLTALDKQDKAMFSIVIKGDNIETHRAICEEGIRDLNATTHRAKEIVSKSDNPQSADSLIIFANRVNELSKAYLSHEVENEINLLNALNANQYIDESMVYQPLQDDIMASMEGYNTAPTIFVNNIEPEYSTYKWYIEQYLVESDNVLRHIKRYMSGAQNTLGPDVNNLSHTAHRSVKPVFITQVVMIVIVVIFYFFFMLYFVRPILRINRSLGSYLAYRMPFDDSIQSRDEIRTVRDRIAELISKRR